MYLSVFDLTDRIAIVTGGGTGLGAAAAEMLAKAGADVMLAGRRPDPLAETAERIRAETGRRVVTLSCDVRDPEQAKTLIEKAVQEFGHLDILINNAGKGTHAPLRTMEPDTWRDDVALNLSAAYYCSRAAYPHLKANGRGVIVNISSVAGVYGTMGVGAYSSAKAGLQQFTRVASAEWGPKGIRVNAIAPGMIETPLARSNWVTRSFDAKAACQSFPLRRPGTPEEVAYAVLFLASDASSYITGETLGVDGGPQIKGMIDVED